MDRLLRRLPLYSPLGEWRRRRGAADDMATGPLGCRLRQRFMDGLTDDVTVRSRRK